MGIYENRILPHLVHFSMGQAPLGAYRRRVVPGAQGRVLEIGVGSGLNLPFYGPATREVVALDPSARLLSMAEEASRRVTSRIALLKGSAEAIPLDDTSVDTVVTTRSPDDGVRRWQERLTPIWRHIGGGCHLNRPIPELLQHAGFHIDRMETSYMQGPKPMTFTYEGSARPV